MKWRNRWIFLGLVPFVLMVVAFQFAPILSMITGSVRPEDGTGFTLSYYARVLQSAFYLKAIKNSLLISVSSSIIGIIVGLICAYSITRFSPRIRNRLLMLSNMTSNFSGVPLAFSYIILLGNNGVFTLLFKQWGWNVFGDFNLYSWTGLILVYVYFQIPLALLLLYPSFYGIRDQWKEAASLLGANKWQFWTTIGIPVLTPAVFGTLGILFANAMGAYATAYALVGGNYNLLAVQIGSLVSGDVVNEPQLGNVLAVILALSTLLAVFLNHKMTQRSQMFNSNSASRQVRKRRTLLRPWATTVKEEL
ncbi:ABC transporter permease [Paenibacillus macquariensis]|uniref:Spermidine/putrescine transport system permease protein n=1 Tax=Paenibacillus macquariensis TaxID=948756 RepID=A0ABY1K5V7_9BACL|nr:ABC transporter permease subunit [Paenibacillus macquariensis]MEC0090516.1 ABC transporter permease subunit [Paenibacillus macquariensis]OAB38517.1 ABC transporter permease [Paenibacillus macquariensis subsp. macquariensis]SIR30452.1 putative spermidine/putrescine transport system permease protein [Paenibacillus macquariensis]